MSDRSKALIPARLVWKRFNISDRTLDRWLNRPELGFPRPAAVINGRRYWDEAELDAWRPQKGTEAA